MTVLIAVMTIMHVMAKILAVPIIAVLAKKAVVVIITLS